MQHYIKEYFIRRFPSETFTGTIIHLFCQLLKDGFVVNTILKEADLFCPNSVRINFTIYR
ncbi:hypothetical protein GB992_02640 [Lactobacillus rossiae]|uniref:Uncharacterized protein n=1 Tax=Furfurilactobacillus rossiae TaxID=231049 RepID=A0A7C9IR78_9LACO|nr:hypothetical protein [Furfurilactobacillus milii]